MQAHVRYVDALYASGKFEEAAAALAQAVGRDATFKSIPEYKVGTELIPADHGGGARVWGTCSSAEALHLTRNCKLLSNAGLPASLTHTRVCLPAALCPPCPCR